MIKYFVSQEKYVAGVHISLKHLKKCEFLFTCKNGLTLKYFSASLGTEQRANAKNRIRSSKIAYFREPPVGVRRCMSLMIILCEQYTEFPGHDMPETLGVTGFLPLHRSLFQ